MRRGRLIAILIAPLLAACGALLGAEWDGTLRSAQVDGSPLDEGGDEEDGGPDRDAASGADTLQAPDTAPIPKTCGGDSKFCLCKAHEPKLDGGVVCSKASVTDGGFCCANKNWPTIGTCLCSEFKCERTSADFCSCKPFGKGTVASCTGAVCCYSPSIAQCSCYDTGIQDCLNITGPEVRVASCTQAPSGPNVPCGADETRVDDCGVVTP